MWQDRLNNYHPNKAKLIKEIEDRHLPRHIINLCYLISTELSLLLGKSRIDFVAHSSEQLLRPFCFPQGPILLPPSPPLPTPVQPSADDLPPTSQTVGRRGCIEHKFLHLLFLLPHSLSFLLGQLLPTLHHSAPSFHSLQASLSFIPVLFAFPSAFNRVALFPHLPTLFFHFWEKNIKSPSYNLRNLCLKHLPKFVVYCLFIFNSDHFWFLCSE